MSATLPSSPGQTVGPFFHIALPYDGGADLVPPGTAGAVVVHGTVRDGAGQPVPDALLELRQAAPDGSVPRVPGSLARAGATFTGWGRVATDPAGRFAFRTLEPGATGPGAAPFFALAVFARGLLDRLFTRAYVPGPATDADPFLAALPAERRGTLVAVREDDGSLLFDVHLHGDAETLFLTFPGHRP